MTHPTPNPEPTLDAGEERALHRWLAGEMDDAEARAFAARLAAEPRLAQRADSLRRLWSGLEAPAGAPGEAVPPGFSTRVMARVREDAARRGGGGLLPARGSLTVAGSRTAGAVALSLGVALGAFLGLGVAPLGAGAWSPGAVDREPASLNGATPDAVVQDTAVESQLAVAYGELYGLSTPDEGSAAASPGSAGTPSPLSGDYGLAEGYAATLDALAGEEGS